MNDPIIKKLNSLGKTIKKMAARMATKDDLKNELKRFATKEDLEQELSQYPTKKDLQEGLDNLFAEIVQAVDKNKADKTQVEDLGKRVAKLEHVYG